MHVIAVEAKFPKLECMCIQRRTQKNLGGGEGGKKVGLDIATGPKVFEKKRGGGNIKEFKSPYKCACKIVRYQRKKKYRLKTPDLKSFFGFPSIPTRDLKTTLRPSTYLETFLF